MITTQELLQQIHETTNLTHLLKNNEQVFNASKFSHKLNQLLNEKSITASFIIKKTQLSKSYVYKLLNGERALSRDSLLQITFSIGCSIDETNELIKYAGVPNLYPKFERDCIIIYAILNNFSLYEIDQLLLQKLLKPLQNKF